MAPYFRVSHRTGPPDIVLRGVWMSYPDRRPAAPVHVLERIDIDIRPGEFVCIVGPSGCGKTTLLNVVAGFVAPTRGEVLVGGEPVRGPDPRRILIFQEGGVFPWLTVRDNIQLGLLRKRRDERVGIVDQYLHLVGLTGLERAYPGELSGGMRQRVEIARALAAEPEALYMDEPFGALDYITRIQIRDDLVQIWMREPKTVLFVTHDIDEAVQLADTVVVMSHKPSIVRAVVRLDLARPRDMGSLDYLRARDRIFNAMGMNPRLGGKSADRPSSVMPPDFSNSPPEYFSDPGSRACVHELSCDPHEERGEKPSRGQLHRRYYPGNQDAHKADGRFSPQPAILATLCADLSCRGNKPPGGGLAEPGGPGLPVSGLIRHTGSHALLHYHPREHAEVFRRNFFGH